jgi:UPF0755 protein
VTLRRAGIALLVLAGLALLGAAAAYGVLQRWLVAPLAVSEATLEFDIPKGQSLAATARDLAARGVLEHPRWLQCYARLTGADASIKAGEYAIPAGTTPRGLLALLESGAVIQHSVTIVEGWTFSDLRRALESEPHLDNTLAAKDEAAVMAAVGEAGTPAEGLFFPDTYLFGKGTTDLEILRQARERMRRELAAAWAARAGDLPVTTPYEALILASIVE